MSLSRWAVERPAALFLLVAVLCAAGVWSGLRLPSSIFPAVTFPRIKVIAEAAEEPAAQMVPAVTRPLDHHARVRRARRPVLLVHRHPARPAARSGRDRAHPPGSPARNPSRRRVD